MRSLEGYGEGPQSETPGERFLNRLSDGHVTSTVENYAMPTGSGEAGKRVLIRGGHVMTMDPELGDFAVGDVLIEGHTITAVAPRIDVSDAEVINAHGRIVMPGFVDTHHHQFETALRSMLPNGLLSGNGGEEGQPNYLEHVLGKLAPVYRPEDVYISELFGSLSQLDAGVTTVLDVSQIHHSPEHSDAAISGLFDAGRRSVFGFFEGAGPQTQYPEDVTRLRRQYFSSDEQLVTMIMGGEIYLPNYERSWALAQDLSMRIALHVVGAMGMGPQMETLARAGRITSSHLLIHMTGMSDVTWSAVAEAGASISLSTPIEMSMRHGMPPILKARELGVPVSLSSDVECTMTADFFTQMRSTVTLQRALVNELALSGSDDLPSLMTSREVLQYATLGGAKALGLDGKIGTISPGKAADLILLDGSAINVSPLNNVPGAVVTLMERSNVETVLVNGRIRKWMGKLIDVDYERLNAALVSSRDSLLERAGLSHRLFD
jgi:cytosine/adenosine deaminase-related metal-dependent hydrolase